MPSQLQRQLNIHTYRISKDKENIKSTHMITLQILSKCLRYHYQF